MKALLIILLTFYSYGSFAQTAYEQAMNEALQLWEAGNSTEAQ